MCFFEIFQLTLLWAANQALIWGRETSRKVALARGLGSRFSISGHVFSTMTARKDLALPLTKKLVPALQ